MTIVCQDDFTGAAASLDTRVPTVGSAWEAAQVSLQGDGTVLCDDTTHFPRQGFGSCQFVAGNPENAGYMEMHFDWGASPGSGAHHLGMSLQILDSAEESMIQLSCQLEIGPGYHNARVDADTTTYITDPPMGSYVVLGDNVLRMEWAVGGVITTKLNGTVLDNTSTWSGQFDESVVWSEGFAGLSWGDSRGTVTDRYRVSSIEVDMTAGGGTVSAFWERRVTSREIL